MNKIGPVVAGLFALLIASATPADEPGSDQSACQIAEELRAVLDKACISCGKGQKPPSDAPAVGERVPMNAAGGCEPCRTPCEGGKYCCPRYCGACCSSGQYGCGNGCAYCCKNPSPDAQKAECKLAADLRKVYEDALKNCPIAQTPPAK